MTKKKSKLIPFGKCSQRLQMMCKAFSRFMKRTQASSLCLSDGAGGGRSVVVLTACSLTHTSACSPPFTCVCVSARLLSGGFSDSDLFDVSKDDTYKPDKGKGNAAPV